MNSKLVLVASIFVAGLASAGCGNACDKYADNLTAKLDECTPGGVSGSTTKPAECTDALLATLSECLDACLDSLTCDGFTGKDVKNATDYAECSTKCSTAK